MVALLIVAAVPSVQHTAGASGSSPITPWQTLASLSTPVYGQSLGTLHDGRLIQAGGTTWPINGNPSGLASVTLYSPTSGQWTPGPQMPRPRSNAGSAVGADGKFYVVGGVGLDLRAATTDTLEIYDPVTSAWTLGADLPTISIYGSAAALPDGRIISLGGIRPGDSYASTAVYAYTPSTNHWTSLAPLPDHCLGMAVATGPDGQVYAAGGACNTTWNWSDKLYIYNPASDTWRAGTPYPGEVRLNAGGTFGGDGRFYLVDGYYTIPDSGQARFLSSVLAYDPPTQTWSSAPDAPIGEYQAAVTTDATGGIILAGGCGGGATTILCPLSGVYRLPTPVPPVLTVTATDATMTYGTKPPAVTSSYAGFVNGDTETSLTTPARCTTTATHTTPAGTYPTTCAGAEDPTYYIGYIDGTITVNPAPLTITASSTTMTYGTTTPTITPSYIGFVNGENVDSLTATATCSTTATSQAPPGVYQSTCQNAAGPNYQLSYTPGTVTITAATTTLQASSLLHTLLHPTAILTRTDNGSPITGETITFRAGGHTVCTAQTNASGLARCANTVLINLGGFTASFAPTTDYLGSTAKATL